MITGRTNIQAEVKKKRINERSSQPKKYEVRNLATTIRNLGITMKKNGVTGVGRSTLGDGTRK